MLSFRVGDPARPRGHAFLFFRDADGSDEVIATYLVVPPIALDLVKYLPAVFAPQVAAQLQPQDAAAYPLPPVPEPFEGGLPRLERLAELRGDDLLDGGTLRLGEPWHAMHPVAEIGRTYAEACAAYVASAAETEPEPTTAAVDVDDLLLQVLPDQEKVSRLARLVGTLRYAVEGGDAQLERDTVAEMQRFSRHLGDTYWVEELVAAAQSVHPRSGELTDLYLQRCYRLVEEDYAALGELERRIGELRQHAGDSPTS